MNVFPYVRFDATPPVKAPPPEDAVHLKWDPDSGILKIEHPDGSSTTMEGGITLTDADARYFKNTEPVVIPDDVEQNGKGEYSSRKISLTTGAGGVFEINADGANIEGTATLTPPDGVGGVIAVTSNPNGFADMFVPPDIDPHVAGAVWNNGGTLAISAG